MDAVLNPLSTKEQQVFVLREVMLHPNLRAICLSAGVVLDSSFLGSQYLGKNIKDVIQLLTEKT